MATGIGHVLKELGPTNRSSVRSAPGAPAMTLSWRERRVITTETADAIADGVAGRFPTPRLSTISSSPPTTHCSCARGRPLSG